MLGLDSPQKLDIVTVQAEEGPQSHERIYEMIMRIGSDRRLGDSADDELPSVGNGNGSGPGFEPPKG